jgi:uncharacterized protein (TIGR02118 family)
VIKIVALLKRKPELSRTEFLQHWSTTHAAIIATLPGLRRYVQNHAIQHETEWPFDGSAELWFDSVRDVAVAFAASEADAMREDEQAFIDSITWFLADEREIKLPQGATT